MPGSRWQDSDSAFTSDRQLRNIDGSVDGAVPMMMKIMKSVFGLLSVLFSASMTAATLDCDRLSGNQRTLCENLVMCSALEQSEARAQCFNAAWRSQDASTVIESKPIVAAPPTTRPVESQPSANAPVLEQHAVIPVRRPSEAAPPSKRATAEKFTAKVVASRDLIRSRQIVFLDNGTLFEGDGPTFAPGVSVEAIKGQFGDYYILSDKRGPNRKLARIPCELEDHDLSDESRHKCDTFNVPR